MNRRLMHRFGIFFIGLALVSACVPKEDSLAKINPYEADPVQTETWSESIYTGPGSTHGITAPRSYLGLGPRKSSLPLSISAQIDAPLMALNWQKTTDRVSGLNTVSKGRCARGVKDSLSTLLGIPNVSPDSVDACEVTENYLNQKFSRAGQYQWTSVPLTEISKAGLKPGDVIVCNRDIPDESWDDSIPCLSGDWGKRSGHIEFVDGFKHLSSDFKQQGSGCLSSNRYQNARVYRMSGASTTALIPFSYEQIFSMFVPSAHATPPTKNPTNATDAPLVAQNPRSTLAKNDDYAVYEEDLDGGPLADASAFLYDVYHKQGERWVRVSRSDISSFHAIEGINDRAAKRSLAKLLVEHEIKSYGRDRLQKKILGRVMFSSAEKDAYINEGFKIPEFFKITQ